MASPLDSRTLASLEKRAVRAGNRVVKALKAHEPVNQEKVPFDYEQAQNGLEKAS